MQAKDVAALNFLSPPPTPPPTPTPTPPVEVEFEVEELEELPQNLPVGRVFSWLFSRAEVAHIEERGREIATRVKTFVPSSGASVKCWIMEQIAGRGC